MRAYGSRAPSRVSGLLPSETCAFLKDLRPPLSEFTQYLQLEIDIVSDIPFYHAPTLDSNHASREICLPPKALSRGESSTGFPSLSLLPELSLKSESILRH